MHYNYYYTLSYILLINTLFYYKNPNKQDLQQTARNHSSNIDFRDSTNLYKKCAAKLFSFLDIDTTLASDNPLRFRKNLFEWI